MKDIDISLLFFSVDGAKIEDFVEISVDPALSAEISQSIDDQGNPRFDIHIPYLNPVIKHHDERWEVSSISNKDFQLEASGRGIGWTIKIFK